MVNRYPGRARIGLVAVAAVAFAALLPGAAASAATPADGSATAGPAASGADIRIVGGDASSAIVCGNVASAETLAQQHHIVLQRSMCSASSTGGSVTLDNVAIYISQSAKALSKTNAELAALVADPSNAAGATCTGRQASPPKSVQLNRCWAVAHGGHLILSNALLVNHRADGSTVSRSVGRMQLPVGDGIAQAACQNIVSDRLAQRDDCGATAAGAEWRLRGVDIVLHNPDGSTSTRRGVTVDIRGGNATASIYCFNVIDGSGRVVQINVCSAEADGGDATLHDVTIHSTS